jgi:hypothetical protein
MFIILCVVASASVVATFAEEFGISALSLHTISSHRGTVLKQSAVQYLN